MLSVAFDRTHLPDMQFLAQNEATLDNEHLLDDRDDDFGSRFAHRGGLRDLFADRHTLDLVGVAAQRNVDFLDLLRGGATDPHPSGLDDTLADVQSLFRESQNNLIDAVVVGFG